MKSSRIRYLTGRPRYTLKANDSLFFKKKIRGKVQKKLYLDVKLSHQ